MKQRLASLEASAAARKEAVRQELEKARLEKEVAMQVRGGLGPGGVVVKVVPQVRLEYSVGCM